MEPEIQYNYWKIAAGVGIYLIAQFIVWYQIQGQFVSEWFAKRPMLMAAMGFPISLMFIYGAGLLVDGFAGDLWPQRLLAFSMGMVAFAILTYVHTGQGINMKTAVTLILALAITLIQVFWKTKN